MTADAPACHARITLRAVVLVGAATAAFAASGAADSQPRRPAGIADVARAYTAQHQPEILRELIAFLQIPNVASDSANIERNAAALAGMLQQRGVETRLLRHPGAPPAVYGSLPVAGARRTLVFYAHYDGQPAAAADWHSDPWQPLLRDGPLHAGVRDLPLERLDGPIDPEWRLYARSASDDKAPIVAMLAGLDALRAAGQKPSVNLKFFFEGEEEAGSPHLEPMLRAHRDLLAADAWIFCDGPVHASGQHQVVFGVRGVLSLEITAYGAQRALHSGHYGNWAPNPIALLVECLASMRAPDGTIRIEGFHADVRPISAAERAALAELPAIESDLLRELALAEPEAGAAPVLERILLPALNLRGIAGGDVDDAARNAIPTHASASIDFRLVPDQTPDAVRSSVEQHLRTHGFHVVAAEPDVATRRQHARILRLDWGPGYPALRTPMDLDVARAVVAAVAEASGRPVLRVPTLGGSLPLHWFGAVLQQPLLIVPMVNYDNNQHAPDENLRLQNLWDGIAIYASLIARLGETW